MTAQELKNSILQLAVQGKLMPQNPADEPASELIKRITDERTRRIAVGTLVMDKKHTAEPITVDDILYDLPDNWKWARFADIVVFNSGKTPQRQNTNYWSNGKFPWVSIADMQADSITTTTKERVSETAFDECFSGNISPAGTMIMSFKLTIGKVSILGMDAVHNEAIISIYPTAPVDDSRILQKWLFKIMPLVAATGNSKNAIKGKTLNATSISNLMVPVPPLAEQERIVAKIEELLPLVAKYDEEEQKLSTLNADFPEMLRKSILQQAVQGKLTERSPSDEPASELLKRIQAEKAKLIAEGKIKKEKPLPPIMDEEKPFDIPDTWVWAPMGVIYNIHSSKRIHAKEYTSEGIPFFRSLEVVSLAKGVEPSVSFYISKTRYDEICQDNIMPKNGDLLIACIGGSIGWNWVVDDRIFYYKDGNVVAFDGHSDFNIEYLRLYLSSPAFLQQIFDDVSGTAYKALTIEMLKGHYIPVPPLAEQKRIVERVNELLAVCDGLK